MTMFTITNLTLIRNENANIVYMALKLKRKVSTELVTTYFPTILLLLITFVTIFLEEARKKSLTQKKLILIRGFAFEKYGPCSKNAQRK